MEQVSQLTDTGNHDEVEEQFDPRRVSLEHRLLLRVWFISEFRHTAQYRLSASTVLVGGEVVRFFEVVFMLSALTRAPSGRGMRRRKSTPSTT